jgi:hypothetical protein
VRLTVLLPLPAILSRCMDTSALQLIAQEQLSERPGRTPHSIYRPPGPQWPDPWPLTVSQTASGRFSCPRLPSGCAQIARFGTRPTEASSHRGLLVRNMHVRCKLAGAAVERRAAAVAYGPRDARYGPRYAEESDATSAWFREPSAARNAGPVAPRMSRRDQRAATSRAGVGQGSARCRQDHARSRPRL